MHTSRPVASLNRQSQNFFSYCLVQSGASLMDWPYLPSVQQRHMPSMGSLQARKLSEPCLIISAWHTSVPKIIEMLNIYIHKIYSFYVHEVIIIIVEGDVYSIVKIRDRINQISLYCFYHYTIYSYHLNVTTFFLYYSSFLISYNCC